MCHSNCLGLALFLTEMNLSAGLWYQFQLLSQCHHLVPGLTALRNGTHALIRSGLVRPSSCRDMKRRHREMRKCKGAGTGSRAVPCQSLFLHFVCKFASSPASLHPRRPAFSRFTAKYRVPVVGPLLLNVEPCLSLTTSQTRSTNELDCYASVRTTFMYSNHYRT
jgi:hypothetical protein